MARTISAQFSSALDAFRNRTIENANKVYREALKEVVGIAVDVTPVLTGRLVANWRITTYAANYQSPDWNNFDPAKGSTKAQLFRFIDGITIYQNANLVNPLPYAYPIEFLNHSRKAPSGMLRVAAAQWVSAVERAAAKYSGRRAINTF